MSALFLLHTPWGTANIPLTERLLMNRSGFVASDALFMILNDRWKSEEASKDTKTPQLIFPYVRGVLAFDTPYNGLARSMFVYGAFSQYQKVSNIWNIMSATSAGLMSARSMNTLSTSSRTAASSAVANTSSASSGWKFWQSVAIKSGAVGAIAAGGVAAYRNRDAIVKGFRNLNKSSIKTGVKEGAENGYDALGQGLAYINRDSVGQSFAWLSSHLKFVGALLRQKELIQRLERLSAIQGIGFKDIYASLGENGYWTGGYFVPERAFCAVPGPEQKANELFTRTVNTAAEDEVQAHMSMFRPQLNDHYDDMAIKARDLCVQWFHSDAEIIDAPELFAPEPAAQEKQVGEETPDDLADIEESPLDIAAAAAIPLPVGEDIELDEKQRQNYLHNLLRISQTAGSGLTSIASLVPSGSTLQSMYGHVPNVSGYVPTSVPSVSGYMPSSVWPFGKGASAEKQGDSTEGTVPGSDETAEPVDIDDDDDVKTDIKQPAQKTAPSKDQEEEGAEQPAGNSMLYPAQQVGQTKLKFDQVHCEGVEREKYNASNEPGEDSQIPEHRYVKASSKRLIPRS